MNDFEMVKMFENVRNCKLNALNMLKEDSQHLKMIAEILIDIEYQLKKFNLFATKSYDNRN